MSQSKKVVLIQPASAGGNFEYIAIPRQGMLFLSEPWGNGMGNTNMNGRYGSRTESDSLIQTKT